VVSWTTWQPAARGRGPAEVRASRHRTRRPDHV